MIKCIIYVSALFPVQGTAALCKSNLDINGKSDILSGTIISQNMLILFNFSDLIKSALSQGFY